MKKLLFTFFAAGMLLTAAYSYNPPAGGEDLTFIGNPSTLSGANQYLVELYSMPTQILF